MTVLPGINNQVITTAYEWLNTPYRHQARLKHKGADCIGLIISIAEEIYGKLPDSFVLPPYSPRWAEESGEQLMVTYGERYLTPVDISEAVPGDVLMFQMLQNGPTKHAGILVGENKIIHAYYPHGVVLTPNIIGTTSKLTHVFRLPEEIVEN